MRKPQLDRAAFSIAKAHVEATRLHEAEPLCILDEHTIEKDYGWVFFYASQKFLETGERRFGLFGNGPILVEKSGSIRTLGTAKPTEEYLQDYEREMNRRKKKPFCKLW